MDKHIGQIFKGITQYRGTRLGPNYIEQETQNAQTQQTNIPCILFVSSNVGVTALERSVKHRNYFDNVIGTNFLAVIFDIQLLYMYTPKLSLHR